MERCSSASRNWLLLLVSFTLFVLTSPAGAQVTKGGATLEGGGAAANQSSAPPVPSSYEGTIRELPFGHNIREQCGLRYFIRLTTGYDILLVTKPNPHAPESEEFAQFDHRVVKLEGYYLPERPQGSDLQMMQSPLTPSDPRNPCGLAVINVVRVVY